MTYTPLKLLIGYIALTFLLIVAGPIEYLGFDVWLTGGYLALVLLAISAGYHLGCQSFAREYSSPPRPARAPPDVVRLFHACLAVGLLGLALSVAQAILAGQLNLSAAELGQTYIDYYEDYERNTGNYSFTFIIYSLAAPPTFIASIWGLLYFHVLSMRTKALVILLIAGTLLFYTVGSGKQKQLGDTVIYFIAVFAITRGRRGRSVNPRTFLAALTTIAVAVIGFVAILGQRYRALSIDAFNINVRGHPLQTFDIDHPFFAWFGYDIGFALAMFTSYLSQGYFGLSLALQSQGTWTYMIGFSYSLMVIANRVFGAPLLASETYPGIVGAETGWGTTKWHSAFTYWASDFTFSGTVLLFGFFAFVYARTWNLSIRYDNPFAVLLFSLMTLGAFFIPANNQIFIAPGSLATAVIVVILFLTFRRRAFPRIMPDGRADS